MDWSRTKDRIVSASQDGHLIVWNALTSQKTHAIKLVCSWVIACAFSSNGHIVACGGLDSVCSVYTLNSQYDQEIPDPKILSGHKGYISCCKFVPNNDAQIITSSGDHTCALWESESCQKISVFGGDASSGHRGDVLRYSLLTRCYSLHFGMSSETCICRKVQKNLANS
jgi:guanine nucleotide-binding protein G(I)/G(S)/G(T) subunit beta-1